MRGRYSAENYDLPEAYVGQNPFLSRVIVTLITDDDMWITRVALPMRTTNAQGEIMWNIWTFDNHALTNVPEEGVSRLLSSKMLTRRGHYERFGLAFILEHGFMNTEQGRMCYEMNLVQVSHESDAFVDQFPVHFFSETDASLSVTNTHVFVVCRSRTRFSRPCTTEASRSTSCASATTSSGASAMAPV